MLTSTGTVLRSLVVSAAAFDLPWRLLEWKKYLHFEFSASQLSIIYLLEAAATGFLPFCWQRGLFLLYGNQFLLNMLVWTTGHPL